MMRFSYPSCFYWQAITQSINISSLISESFVYWHKVTMLTRLFYEMVEIVLVNDKVCIIMTLRLIK